MDTTRRASAAFYRAAEVAEMLRCSEWWIKEQARHRRIPYSWIGGSYLFTEEHVAEIVRLFEVRPGKWRHRRQQLLVPGMQTRQPIRAQPIWWHVCRVGHTQEAA